MRVLGVTTKILPEYIKKDKFIYNYDNMYINLNDVLFYTYVCVCINRRLISYCRSLNTSKNMSLNYSVSDDAIYFVRDYYLMLNY